MLINPGLLPSLLLGFFKSIPSLTNGRSYTNTYKYYCPLQDLFVYFRHFAHPLFIGKPLTNVAGVAFHFQLRTFVTFYTLSAYKPLVGFVLTLFLGFFAIIMTNPAVQSGIFRARKWSNRSPCSSGVTRNSKVSALAAFIGFPSSGFIGMVKEIEKRR